VGLPLEPAGLLAVDVDCPGAHEGDGFATLRALEEELGQLPASWTQATGSGGLHLVFRFEGEAVGSLGPGIHVRRRGYIVVEPSVHPCGGLYSWSVAPESMEPAELPEPWLQRLRKQAPPPRPEVEWQAPASPPPGGATVYGARALADECTEVARAPEGSRNERLNRAAFSLGQLVGGGELDAGVVEAELLAAAGFAGLPDGEARKTLRSGLESGAREPRQAPPRESGQPRPHREEPPLWEPDGEEREPEVVLPEEVERVPGPRAGQGAVPEWEPLSPFEELACPEFPVSVLPTVLRSWVEEIAGELEVPLALPGCLALGALAACVSNRLHVEVKRGYSEPCNLSVAVALPPAERKSAVFAAAFEPLQVWEQRAVERETPRVCEALEERHALEKRLEHLRTKLAKVCEPYERANALAEVKELALELVHQEVPSLPRLLCDDTTPERLAVLMSEHNGRMAVASSEGGLFDALAGRYSDGKLNLDIFLKSWSGDMLSVDRVGRAPVHIDRPALTTVLALQPSVLQGLASQPAFRGRGLLARFLYALPSSALGSRTFDGEPLAASTRNAYHSLLHRLLDGELDGQELELSPEARERWLAFALELEPKLRAGGELASMSDWTGKLPGQVARLAGLLHCARYPEAPHAHPVLLGDTGAAVALGEFFLAHARLAFGLMDSHPEVDRAKRLVRWLKRERLATFTKRDAHQAHRSLFPTVDELGPTLGLLERHGYIRAREHKERSRAGGRPPSTTYDVHPSLRGES
jgi:hypothetical protein